MKLELHEHSVVTVWHCSVLISQMIQQERFSRSQVESAPFAVTPWYPEVRIY